MSRRGLVAMGVLGIALAASAAAARQGIFEYGKAGARTRRSGSTTTRGQASPRQTGPQTSAPSAAAPTTPSWTEAWFADATLVRKRLADIVQAVKVPMIGETYPLPKGGGFVCSRIEGNGASAGGGLTCVLRCDGPELGGRRRNWFYVDRPDGAPVLDRVRWSMPAPRPTPSARWHEFFVALADSITSVMGPPAQGSADGAGVAWSGGGYRTSLRLHGGPAKVDSMEIECLSDRLATRMAP
jgi:hypothetical protein